MRSTRVHTLLSNRADADSVQSAWNQLPYGGFKAHLEAIVTDLAARSIGSDSDHIYFIEEALAIKPRFSIKSLRSNLEYLKKELDDEISGRIFSSLLLLAAIAASAPFSVPVVFLLAVPVIYFYNRIKITKRKSRLRILKHALESSHTIKPIGENALADSPSQLAQQLITQRNDVQSTSWNQLKQKHAFLDTKNLRKTVRRLASSDAFPREKVRCAEKGLSLMLQVLSAYVSSASNPSVHEVKNNLIREFHKEEYKEHVFVAGYLLFTIGCVVAAVTVGIIASTASGGIVPAMLIIATLLYLGMSADSLWNGCFPHSMRSETLEALCGGMSFRGAILTTLRADVMMATGVIVSPNTITSVTPLIEGCVVPVPLPVATREPPRGIVTQVFSKP